MTTPTDGADRATLSTTRFEGPSPEWGVGRDMIKRGLIAGPVLVALCGVIWGADGVWSALYGLAIVLVNFALAALTIAITARISLAVMMGAVLFGYLVRLALIFAAVWLVQTESWISFPALGATIIVSHLGLLIWELRHVSMSLAYPGLKPADPTAAVSPTAPPPADH
ncbi:MAG: ATP synthase subunit I [Actinomycetota bacterium]